MTDLSSHLPSAGDSFMQHQLLMDGGLITFRIELNKIKHLPNPYLLSVLMVTPLPENVSDVRVTADAAGMLYVVALYGVYVEEHGESKTQSRIQRMVHDGQSWSIL